jgi:hypothetical protein
LIGSYQMDRGADIIIDAVDPLYPNANYPSGFIAFRTSKYTESVTQPDMVEVLRITNAGNIGINTTTPTAFLNITNISGSNLIDLIHVDVDNITKFNIDISGNTIVTGKLDANNINVKTYLGATGKQVIDSVTALVADWSILVRDTASNAYFASSVKALSGNTVPDYTVYSVLGTSGLSPDFGVEMSGANMNLYVDYPNTYNAKSTRINIDTSGI